ncbi:MAG: N-acetylmuramoyl-L-alanine amidase family protein [Cephaloticoccus sp.]
MTSRKQPRRTTPEPGAVRGTSHVSWLRGPGPVAWFVLLVALLGLVPVLPAAGKNIRVGGVNYVDAVDFGARFGLKATSSGRKLTLKSAWTTIELEAESRECRYNGLRVFLGDASRAYRGAILVSRTDADRLFNPLLLPGDGQTKVPELRTIVIDPGHGGRDPGKENRRLKVNEKTMALDTALRLQRMLENMGYRVLLTRTEDRHLGADKASDLLERGAMAKRAGADLFISLHYNAVGSDPQRVSGVEVYSLTPQHQYSTSDPEQDDDKGAAEFNVGNAQDHWNILLGYHVHRRLVEELKVSDRGLKRARWAVLRHAECPAILVEAGFLSNDAEARRIATPEYRQRIADAIAHGVEAYGAILAGVRKQRAGR